MTAPALIAWRSLLATAEVEVVRSLDPADDRAPYRPLILVDDREVTSEIAFLAGPHLGPRSRPTDYHARSVDARIAGCFALEALANQSYESHSVPLPLLVQIDDSRSASLLAASMRWRIADLSLAR